MSRNIDGDYSLFSIVKLLAELNSEEEVYSFLLEVLSESELSLLSKRWRILEMLADGRTQRDIAAELGVSLCKVTRGSKILKKSESVVTKYLIKEKKNGYKFNKK